MLLYQVVNKIAMLVEAFSSDEAISMLAHLEHRMRTKQGVMKNGPGYLDVAVSSHLDMLKVRFVNAPYMCSHASARVVFWALFMTPHHLDNIISRLSLIPATHYISHAP